MSLDVFLPYKDHVYHMCSEASLDIHWKLLVLLEAFLWHIKYTHVIINSGIMI